MPPSPPAESRSTRRCSRAWPLPADEHDDKHGRGTVLVIGGSAATPGAVLLAGAPRCGSAPAACRSPPRRSVAPTVAVTMVEARVVPLDRLGAPAVIELVEQADAIVVGPGLDPGEGVDRLVATVLERADPAAIVVLDAAAIGSVVAHRDAIHARPGGVVITPNHQELELLAGAGADGDDRAASVALAHGVTVTSFGRVVAADGRVWSDPQEPCGLGTSGAGDVLAGAVAGLGARCHDGPQAACWATAAHRVASDRLAARGAPVGYLARELADELAPSLAVLGVSQQDGDRPRGERADLRSGR